MKYGDIENIAETITKRFSELELRIMAELVELIKVNGFSSASSDYLVNKLRELGQSEENIAEYIQEALKDTDVELNKIFDDLVYQEYYGHQRAYKVVGFEQVPYKDNIQLQQFVSGIYEQTQASISGLSRSLGFVLIGANGVKIAMPIQKFFEQELDGAIMDITSGAFSYNTVIERVINRMTKSGIRVINYQSGVHRQMSSQVRTNILTGFRQIQGRINEQVAQDLGTNDFEVSWHRGARPSHQPWQGKVWSKEQLITVCGLGDVAGLKGANCHHDYTPFIKGVSTRRYTDDWLEEQNALENIKIPYGEKEYTTYEALQHQRYLERLARKYRQDIYLMQKGGLADADELILKQARYRNTINKYNDFIDKMGLPSQRDRIYRDGLGKINTKRYDKVKKDLLKKYNTDDEVYATRRFVMDHRIEQLIKSDAYSKEMRKKKQLNHYKDNPGYQEGKSYFTIPIEELEKLVLSKMGSGLKKRSSAGKWVEKERLDFDKAVGVWVEKDTDRSIETNSVMVSYSKKKGWHVVPAKPRKG